MHPRKVIAKTLNLIYSLNVPVTAYGRQTVPDRSVIRSCEPIKNYGAPIISLVRLNLKSSKFVHYINSNNMMTYHPQKGAWLWPRDCFKVLPFAMMQLVAWVCQRQLSYLLRYTDILVENRRFEPTPPLFGVPVRAPKFLASENENPGAITWCYLCDPMFSHFDMPDCYWQTNRQTDGQTDGQ